MLRTHMRSVELGPLTILLDLKRNKYLTLPTKSLAQALETQAPQNALWMKLQAAQMIEPPARPRSRRRTRGSGLLFDGRRCKSPAAAST